MALPTTAQLSELNLKSSSSLSFSLTPPSRSSTFFLSLSKFPFRTLTLTPLSSLRTTQHSNNRSSPKSTNPPAPWHSKLPSSNHSSKRVTESNTKDSFDDKVETRHFDGDKGQNAVQRIVLRLRNLGLGDEEDEDNEKEDKKENEEACSDVSPVTGEERLSELLRREWVRPDAMVVEDKVDDEVVLPWEREGEKEEEEKGGGGVEWEKGLRRRSAKAPTLAELTLEDEVLRRLRREGMRIRERISVPKAGLTKEVMEKIHTRWRKEELVRLKFHEDLARDMKTAHEIVEVVALV